MTAHDYVPSVGTSHHYNLPSKGLPDWPCIVDDVLRARLKTLGVIEHRFTLEKGEQINIVTTWVPSSFFQPPVGYDKGVDWLIYDVGGARNQRQAWAPFFDDVNALIFLAPISAFDQVLVEEPDVNRVEDSLLLWRSVVSSKVGPSFYAIRPSGIDN